MKVSELIKQLNYWNSDDFVIMSMLHNDLSGEHLVKRTQHVDYITGDEYGNPIINGDSCSEQVENFGDEDKKKILTFEFIKQLPIFEDTGERFLQGEVWGVFKTQFPNRVAQGELMLSGKQWSLWNDDIKRHAYKFYSTKEAAKAVMKDS